MPLLKYAIYAMLVVVLYMVAKEFYDGNFDNKTITNGIKEQVITESENMTDTQKNVEKNFAN